MTDLPFSLSLSRSRCTVAITTSFPRSSGDSSSGGSSTEPHPPSVTHSPQPLQQLCYKKIACALKRRPQPTNQPASDSNQAEARKMREKRKANQPASKPASQPLRQDRQKNDR
ncbi:hypothetical protein BKA80DRAFT_277196 [Phyllosticta citrichinensis]